MAGNAVLVTHLAERWVPALHAAAPELALRVYPELGDLRDIDCLLTWQVADWLIDALPNLQLLYAVGAGVDPLVEVARRHPRLRLARVADDAVTGDVASLAVAATLQWFRDLLPYARLQEHVIWQPQPHRCSADTTVAVLGLGRIGCAAAAAFQALGFQVCGWSRSVKELPGVATFNGDEGLRTVLPRAQVLVCTLPLTPETAGIIGARTLELLPRGAFLVNVGRGGHVDEDALLAALERGHLAGAFLDVFATEPLPAQHPFWRHPAVRMTPHAASRTQAHRVAPQIVENLSRLRAGEPLLNLVDPAAGY